METNPHHENQRREVFGRDNGIIVDIAIRLRNRGVEPNTISLASIGFAVVGAVGLAVLGSDWEPTRWIVIPVVLLAILLRCLCNVWDGLVAVEGGLGRADGAFFNEFPDRVADLLLLGAAGLAWRCDATGLLLGLATGMMALAVAYIRALGGSLTGEQIFSGIMAKPIRMAVLAAGLVASAWLGPVAIGICLAAVIIGCLITCATRSQRILALLRA